MITDGSDHILVLFEDHTQTKGHWEVCGVFVCVYVWWRVCVLGLRGSCRGFGEGGQGVGEVTQVGDTDRGGGTVQSPCLNLQTNPA